MVFHILWVAKLRVARRRVRGKVGRPQERVRGPAAAVVVSQYLCVCDGASSVLCCGTDD